MVGLSQKLGIRPGQSVCLLSAAPTAVVLLRRECPEPVSFSHSLGAEKYNIIMFWPTSIAGLDEEFARLQHHIVPDGAIWVVIPKKEFAKARGVELTWAQMQEAALKTDLVDNKSVTFSDEEYATRFVIRKDRRGKYD